MLEETDGNSVKGFFYLGVALYKMRYYVCAIKAYHKSLDLLLPDTDAQTEYNLGLGYFKMEQYTIAVICFKDCIEKDPKHQYAYNNLCFLYN